MDRLEGHLKELKTENASLAEQRKQSLSEGRHLKVRLQETEVAAADEVERVRAEASADVSRVTNEASSQLGSATAGFGNNEEMGPVWFMSSFWRSSGGPVTATGHATPDTHAATRCFRLDGDQCTDAFGNTFSPAAARNC
jgi:hypothetical protein